MNLSTVKTSSFTQFTKPSDITYSVSIEKYENYLFKIYIYIYRHIFMWMYVVIFQ